jgi:hypothetical protein
MAYVSDWERLSAATVRVMAAAGVSKDEAQTAISQAIADGTVKIRGRLRRQATGPMRSSTVLEGTAFEIPTDFESEDLDWERSRPVKPWIVRRQAFSLPGYWTLEWLELFGPDVTRVLCPAGKPSESTKHASSKQCAPWPWDRPARR